MTIASFTTELTMGFHPVVPHFQPDLLPESFRRVQSRFLDIMRYEQGNTKPITQENVFLRMMNWALDPKTDPENFFSQEERRVYDFFQAFQVQLMRSWETTVLTPDKLRVAAFTLEAGKDIAVVLKDPPDSPRRRNAAFFTSCINALAEQDVVFGTDLKILWDAAQKQAALMRFFEESGYDVKHLQYANEAEMKKYHSAGSIDFIAYDRNNNRILLVNSQIDQARDKFCGRMLDVARVTMPRRFTRDVRRPDQEPRTTHITIGGEERGILLIKAQLSIRHELIQLHKLDTTTPYSYVRIQLPQPEECLQNGLLQNHERTTILQALSKLSQAQGK